MRILYSLLYLFIIACTSSASVSSQWFVDNKKLKILCSTAMIGDLCKKIGGADSDTLVLIRGELDPHSYQPVKGDDEKFAFANVIFFSGLGLEHSAPMQQYAKELPKIVLIGDLIEDKDPQSIIYHGSVPDPHIWMDVGLWTKACRIIADVLSKNDPIHAEDYQRRSQELVLTLNALDQELYSLIQSVPHERRFLITSHDAFHYFGRRYLATREEFFNGTWQDRVSAPQGLAPASQMSLADIQRVVDFSLERNVNVLFAESNLNKDGIRKILDACAEKNHVMRIATQPLFGDTMGDHKSGAGTYEEMLRHNASVIAENLREDA